MKKAAILTFLALLSLPLAAQVSNPSIISVAGAPSGACNVNLPDQQVVVAGTLYTCQNGTWAQLSGGGGGGLPSGTIGQIPSYTTTGTTVQAINISKIPVEFYGAIAYLSAAAAEAGPDDTAKFQSAVTAAGALPGVATCQAGLFYHVVGPLNFTSYSGLSGTSNQTYSGHCNLVSTSATANILSAVGTSGSPVTGVTLAHLTIIRSLIGTGTAAGIYASFTAGMIVTDTVSENSIYDYYRHASPGDGIGYWSYNQASWSVGFASSGTYYGFYDDSADGNAENSIILSHSAVSCANLTGTAVGYGQILTGTAVNDNTTWDFNTAGCSYGQVVNYTGSGGSFATNDIHFYGSTHDGIGISCYKISNLSLATDGYVEINGGHCNASVSVSPLIDIESSYGVKVAGVNINQHDGFGATHAIYAANSSGLVFANNTITNFGTTTATSTPIEITGVTHSTFTGNAVVAKSTNAGNILWVTGNSTYNTITGNNLSGFSTGGAGIGIDAGSNNNTIWPNSIDATNMIAATTDAGTLNGVSQATQFNFTNTTANVHVPLLFEIAPNATAGSTSLIYERFGEGLATNNDIGKFFVYQANGSTSNAYGWEFFGASAFNAQMFANISTEFGETTPAVGPANGIAVGTTGQATIDGSGNATFTKVNVASARKGTFVCTAGGTITISNTNELVTSDVIISLNTAGGTISTAPAMKTVTSGTGFTVLCGASDTSTYNYSILN